MKLPIYLTLLLSLCLSIEASAPAKSVVTTYLVQPVKDYWKKGLALAAVVYGVQSGYRAYQRHKLLKEEGVRNESILPGLR